MCIISTYEGGLLLEKVPVDLKLLFEHDLSSVLDDEGARLQVLGRPQNLPVLLHACNAAQLELKCIHTQQQQLKSHKQLTKEHTGNIPVTIPLTEPSTKLGTIEHQMVR